MAKRKTKTKKKGSGRKSAAPKDLSGKQLVIVESPAKAKTINRYLGPDYVVQASVGHIRALPAKAEKGSKQPVPGVDIANQFKPTYAVLADKKKTVSDLKRAAKQATEIWFATDLDREGEAIAWHLAQELGIDPSKAKRVIFNAITKSQIKHAFENPQTIDMYKVNAQQARRILDRIVGYQVSPLLWKKVARGLSAGRVQSVAVRMVVEREREIRSFVPDESWRLTARLSINPAAAPGLVEVWDTFQARTDDNGKGPTIKEQNQWLAKHKSIKTELVEVNGKKVDISCKADKPKDLSQVVERAAQAAGLIDIKISQEEDPNGKGPAKTKRLLSATVDPSARYQVDSIQTKRTSSRPNAPFITSSLQATAASYLGFAAERTMRLAQSLYEGIEVPDEGQVGLITYMRTDSTFISPEAITDVRQLIVENYGDAYLPDKPNYFTKASKNKTQDAHEAIRPADVQRHPDYLVGALNPDQLKLYRLIWTRFVGSQMNPAQWDSTAVTFKRSDKDTGAVLRTTGRVLVFDGFYKATGVPTSSDEQTLPEFAEKDELAPFSMNMDQLFSSPSPRFSEASLIKSLESEGIGRPSTYAAIIRVIQDRNYVEQIERRFFATDLGEVVTDKLIEGFPQLMEISYTRQLEDKLDKIEEQHTDWTTMLQEFYEPFAIALENAHKTMIHAKAEMQPAIYQCPKCSSSTCYRFGKNGRFLSCTTYPDCDYAAPIDREGRPMLPERVDVSCPEDNSPMVMRSGRFGKFLASVNYPEIKCVVNLDKKGQIKYPATPPVLTSLECPKCDKPMNLRRGKRGPWLGCSTFPKCRGRQAWTKLEDDVRAKLEAELEAHEKLHPQVVVRTLDGEIIPEGTPIADLVLPGGVAELGIHPSADLPRAKTG